MIIQVDKYVAFKNEEKYLDKILALIESLIDFQKDKKLKFISFSSSFFKSMTKLINEKNLDNQQLSLKKILSSEKFLEISSKYDKILNNSIVEKDFEFVKNGKYYKNLDEYDIN